MSKKHNDIPEQMEKEVIYAKKHVEWMSEHMPNADTSQIEERIKTFEASLPDLKVAWKLAQKMGKNPQEFLESPAFLQTVDTQYNKLKKVPALIANKILSKFGTNKVELEGLAKNSRTMLETFTQNGMLKRLTDKVVERGLPEENKEAHYELTRKLKDPLANDSPSDFDKKVDDNIEKLDGLAPPRDTLGLG